MVVISVQDIGSTWCYTLCGWFNIPDSKVNVANMGPIWGRQDPGGPHVGPINFAIWNLLCLASGAPPPNAIVSWLPSLWWSDSDPYTGIVLGRIQLHLKWTQASYCKIHPSWRVAQPIYESKPCWATYTTVVADHYSISSLLDLQVI